MRVLDLFSGIGGFSLGLERAGMETVAFCEIDSFCQKVLRKHWPDVSIYDDVRELTNDQLKADGITNIDVICGGFPCQDLSISGKQAGIGAKRSGLWSEYARIIGEVRPAYAIVENVTALLSGDSGRWFGKVLGDLAEIGYDCEWNCVPATYLGARHIRDRVWIIAHPVSDRLQGPILNGYSIKKAGVAFDWGAPARALDAFDIKRWTPESTVLRTNDDAPNWVDRIKSLGNAVVPQIPELIGRAIMEAA